MYPNNYTFRRIARLGLPITGWFAGGALAFVQCAIGVVAPSYTGHAMLAMAAVGLLAGLVELAACAAGRTVSHWLGKRGWLPATALAATLTGFLAPGLLWMSAAALSGRRMAALPFRSVLVALATILMLSLVFIFTRLLAARARRLQDGPLPAAALALAVPAFLVLAGSLVWADNRMLVRRYEWFHLGLQLGAFVALQAALLAVGALVARLKTRAERPRQSRTVPLAMLTACLALLMGWRSSDFLWRDDQDSARAQIFAADGAVASALELLRPAHGFAVEAARPSAGVGAGEDPLARPFAPEPAPFPGADVILVTVDALRADHLGFAGYRRPTSPNLDALAARSTVFERAYTPSPHTSYAIASILTGRHSFSLARAGLLAPARTLADVFGAAGYATIGLFPPAVFFVERERFGALEARRYGFATTRFESLEEPRDAPVRTDQAISALDQAGRQPAFLWVHYFGPHEPYVHQPDLAGSPLFGSAAVDRYDEEIRYVDRELGRLVQHLDARRRPYVLVLTADHGEEFGEHGGAYHGTTLFDEQIRVPLLVHVPAGVGRRVRAPVSTVDIAATLATLVGLPWRAPEDSVDRAPAVLEDRPPGSSDVDSAPALAELESMKALMAGQRKLVCDTARDYCHLFDLAKDPGERRDLAPALPQVVAGMRGQLEAWLRRPPDLAPPRPLSALLWAAQRGDASALSRLGQVLVAPVGDESPTDSERRTAAKVMAGAPRPEYRGALTRAFQSDPDPVVRTWAAVALAGLGDATAIVSVAEARALRLGQAELDSRAALALAGAAHDGAGQAIIDVLPLEQDVHLRCRLVSALADSGHPRAGPVLLEAYAHLRSRNCVAKALGRIRQEAVLAFLMARVIDEPYTTVRAALARSLGVWSNNPAAESTLRQVFLTDPDQAVTAAAARALAGLGTALPTVKGRSLRVPPDARELWVVTGPASDRPLRISAGNRRRLALTTNIDLRVKRDAYSLPLTPGEVRFVRVTGPATHALFR